MRLSTLFVRTLRDDPADAEVASHKLLVRAGYVRRAAPGVFSWLPLGWSVYRRIEEIVRTGMTDAGFQEVHFPALLPREPYEASNRWTAYGDDLFRLKDRRGVDYLLGPTHEEMFTLLVKDLYSSYKDLPLSIFQIQIKYRDEARPRAGILRGREFVMKDSYSFDTSDDGLRASYQAHRDAYIKTFDLLGLEYVIVSAMSGAMGGSASEEFISPSPVGEDTFVRCPTCGLAANVEAVHTPPPAPPSSAVGPAHVEDTPDTPTIDTLVAMVNERFPRSDGRAWTAADTLKNVVLKVSSPDGSTRVLAVGLPGDREVDMKRLEAQLSPATAEPLDEAGFAALPQLAKGYIGPGALGRDKPAGVEFLVDPRVVPGTAWVTGADRKGRHVLDLVCGRDFTPDGTIEAAEVLAGDACPACAAAVPPRAGALELARGIEIGHIFQLGRKYADALGLKVLDEHGKQVTVTMGSYGIGVSRLVAVIAEQCHDELGLRWPRAVAPADVHLVATGKDAAAFDKAEELAVAMERAGLRVLYDDRRGVSPGVKFKDAELLGMPTIVIVGKGLEDGVVEVRDRMTGAKDLVPVGGALDAIVAACRG